MSLHHPKFFRTRWLHTSTVVSRATKFGMVSYHYQSMNFSTRPHPHPWSGHLETKFFSQSHSHTKTVEPSRMSIYLSKSYHKNTQVMSILQPFFQRDWQQIGITHPYLRCFLTKGAFVGNMPSTDDLCSLQTSLTQQISTENVLTLTVFNISYR